MELCVCVSVRVSAIGVHISGPICTRFGKGEALTYREGYGKVGFAARPPGGMWQTLEPRKPESAYMSSVK